MLRQTIKKLKWLCRQVRFEKFLEMYVQCLTRTEYSLADCSRQQGRHDWLFSRWLPVQEVTGRLEARPRRRCCSEFNYLGHVGTSLHGWCEWGASGGTICREFVILSAARTGGIWSLASYVSYDHCPTTDMGTFSWSRREEHQSQMSVTQQHSWWRMLSISETLPYW